MNESCLWWFNHRWIIVCPTQRRCVCSICVTCLLHMFNKTLWLNHQRHDSFMNHMTHTEKVPALYVWHDSFICVTWLIHMRDMTHSYVWHDSFTCVIWLIHWIIRDMTHSCNPHGENMSAFYIQHHSCICVYVWLHSYTCVTSLMYMCDFTHIHVWHHSFICVTSLIYMCDMTHS